MDPEVRGGTAGSPGVAPTLAAELAARGADPEPPPAAALGEPTDELPRGERASTLFLVILAGLSCAADLVTKGWAHARLAGVDGRRGGGRSVTLIEGHLDFIFAQNPGGAWSFLRGLPDGLRRPFFLFVSAAAIVFIVSIYRRVHRDQTAMKWGLPLALGGALGNLVDRVRFGWVIDFIDVYVTRGGREHHWPTFNVADIAIVVGVVLMGLDMVFTSRRAQAEERQAREAQQARQASLAAPGLEPLGAPAGQAGPAAASEGFVAEPGYAPRPPEPPPAA
ncbi:MAG TPA: signal peptidase II [Candidatus Nanopelagicales bacterium]|nr:signal peptidase II [Candidatus Nanopelagicales bacterium]